ncbi:MAG: hypothetical protein ACK4JB_04795 [Reyranella sp.]
MSSTRILRAALVIGAAGLLGACADGWATTQVTPTAAAAGRARTPVDKIQIIEGDVTDRPYKSLGDVSVTVNKTTLFNADPTREMVNNRLRAEAAKLGADAVIQVRYGTVGMGLVSWGSLDGKGRAIAYDAQ